MVDSKRFNGAVAFNGAITSTGTNTHSGTNTFSGDLTSTGILKHTNASGKYVNGKNTVVKNVEFTASATVINSGAIHVPANSVIQRIEVVVTEALAYGSGTLGVRAGTSAGDTTYMALDADSLASTASTLAVGKGTSTGGAQATALGGNATLVIAANAAHIATAGAIHVQVVNSGTAFTDGTIAFIVEFAYLGGN